jgi:hypothetical protein
MSAQARMAATVSRGRALWLRTALCCASNRAREEPPGRPRWPRCRAACKLRHVSPGAFKTGPLLSVGQPPVRCRCVSAHARMCCSVSRGRSARLRTRRYSASRRAKDESPRKPRLPFRSALSTACQVSPGASMIGPESWLGQFPVRS